VSAGGKRYLFVRRTDAGELLDIFLVMAVGTLLAIRFFLAATGYPQVGGGELHIAHMLWGGLGMMAALVVVFTLQGRLWLAVAAAGGGAGFGTFIDELGKFITKDNDYFFKPTIALIYLIFIVLYLVFRSIGRLKKLSPQERLVNALDLAMESEMHELDPRDRDAALGLLAGCGQTDGTVVTLQALLRRTHTAEDVTRTRLARFGAGARRLYRRIVDRRWFRLVFVGLFVVIALFSLGVGVVAVAAYLAEGLAGGGLTPTGTDLISIGQLLTGIAIGLFTLLGIIVWRRSRLGAYHWFLRAVLVGIFVGGFLSFYESQLGALVDLVLLVLVWACLRLMIAQEVVREADDRTPASGTVEPAS
jgi:hypothetical protein